MWGSWLRIIQLPKEFAEFLVWMSENEINTYMEVGVSTGGSWFFVDSYLRAVNPNYRGSVGYDTASKLRDSEAYFRRFPSAKFRHRGSTQIHLRGQFDLAFIDATHEENWVWHDFNKVKDNCRFVAFHDIVLRNASVDKFWNAAKKRYQHWEFIDRSLPETAGIGVLKVK